MLGISSLENLKRFDSQHALYCVYVDNLFYPEKTDAIAEMKKGFDYLAGSYFHMLFPTQENGLTAKFRPTRNNYDLNVAQQIVSKFDLPQEALPLLLFPSVRDGESLLAVKLDHPDVNDAIRRILEITKIAIKQSPLDGMTPEEFRKNTIKHIRNSDLDSTAENVAIASSAFLFLHYAPSGLEAVLDLLF